MIPYFILFFVFFACSNKNSQTTQFVNSSDGVRIGYQVHGDGEIPLVFVHGWSCDKSYWKNQTNYFKEKYKVVLVDLAGHGQSDIGREDYTIQMFANDVSAVIKHLDLKNVILLGHSLGGQVVLETATQNLNNTKAIFIIDSFRNIPTIKNKEELNEVIERYRNRWTVKDFQSDAYEWLKGWYHPESDSTLIEWIAKDMSSNDPNVSVSAYVNHYIYYNRDIRKSLKAINDIPIISITANGLANVDEFREFGINFNAVKIDDASHFLMMSPADTFNLLLNSQLDSLLMK